MSTTTSALPDPDQDHDHNEGSSPAPRPNRSRLDREVEEILSKASATPPPPIPFKERVARKTSTSRWRGPDLRSLGTRALGWLTAIPILTALALAILAMLVGDASPLLARLLSIAAVAMLLYPIVRQARGGAAPSTPKMWRGQMLESRPLPTSPLDQIKRWFRPRPPR
ncbi:MAG TPA: hypothetical protein VNZ55_13900 [Thermomicrobiales bacterium]|nr:hypothetical protein [Thermomicrobiales bacterium]